MSADAGNNNTSSIGWGLIVFILIAVSMFGGDGGGAGDDKIDKIIKAKATVRAQLNYPDTADFHDLKTEVNGNVVHLVVTAQNAFGVPSTHTFDITVD
ncbi:MAG: hypothetical protein NZ777_04080 [Pseudomonadales bacterium]|nr:hypothetical protein [Pseudomonadales bacterium]